jgi:hypothetical protein
LNKGIKIYKEKAYSKKELFNNNMATIIIPKYNPATGEGTLSHIARQYGTDVSTLQRMNPTITDVDKIVAGASLNVPDITTGGELSPIGATAGAGTPPPATLPAGTTPTGGTTGMGMGTTDPMRFYSIMDAMSQKLNKNQELVDMRNKVFTGLYDRDLTDEEKASLTPELQHAFEVGDFNFINTQVRLINDEIKGRKATMDQSMQFLTTGYMAQMEQLENQRNRAEDRVWDFVKEYGGAAESALRGAYGDEWVDSLGRMGIDVSGMGAVPMPKTDEALTYKQKVDLEVKIGNNFERYARESRQAVRSIGIIETGYKAIQDVIARGEGSLNAPSQAMLVTFQKMLDPTSVVRESEYARSGTGLSLANRIEGLYAKLASGGAGISGQDLKEFYDLSLQLQEGYQEQMVNFAERAAIQAKNYGLDLENILTPDVMNLLKEKTATGNPEADLEDDIRTNKNLYQTREQLIDALVSLYSEFTRDKIASKVYQLIPDIK